VNRGASGVPVHDMVQDRMRGISLTQQSHDEAVSDVRPS